MTSRTHPLVTAVMAAHNCEFTIATAIRSILQQTLPDFELVVVDDGSTDRTGDLVKEFTDDSRVRLLTNSQMLGSAASRNIAVQNSSAPFLAVCDADDISLPHRFERQYRRLSGDGSLAVCGAQVVTFGRDQICAVGNFPVDPLEIRRQLHQFRMPIAHCSAMIRRSIFLEVSGYDEDLLRAQDFDLFLRMSDAKMLSLPQVELLYRRTIPTPYKYAIRSGRGGSLAKVKSRHGRSSNLTPPQVLASDTRTTMSWIRQRFAERESLRGLF